MFQFFHIGYIIVLDANVHKAGCYVWFYGNQLIIRKFFASFSSFQGWQKYEKYYKYTDC